MAKKEHELEPQQERFCQEYLKDLNAKHAAIRAGYSEKTAQEQGSRLLSKAKVQDRVQQLMERRAKRNDVSSDKILRELQRLGYSDIRALYDDKGCIKEPKDWPEAVARAVKSIEVFEEYDREGVYVGRTKKVSFWEKTKALDLLGKHKALYTEKVEHSATGTLAEILSGTWGKKEGEE